MNILKIINKITVVVLLFFIFAVLNADVEVSIIEPSYQLGYDEEVTLSVNVSGLTQAMRAFEINISYNTNYFSSAQSDLKEGDFLRDSGDETEWYVTGENGDYTVTCSILGVSSGSSGSGTLFTLLLSNQNQDIFAGTEIVLSRVILRDLLNNEISVDQINNSIIYIDASPVYININILLEGPYLNGGSMSHNLVDAGYIPTISPYDSEDIVSLPDVSPHFIVDWVNIQLRTSANGSTVKSSNAFVLNNGLVVDVEGNSSLPFYFTSDVEYFLKIDHRNHLPVMTRNKIILSDDPEIVTELDFTDQANAYGSGSLKQLESEEYGLYGGDADQDGNIFPNDRNDYWRVQTGQSGYKSADFNLDGNVLPTDLDDLWRVNSGISSQLP
ncbi:MAG: cohesin domain-containing protein [Candidatus Tenebribacter burtonii]|nr:cohesin domain-containing protein [Candidatus Tenebribacter burtonii]